MSDIKTPGLDLLHDLGEIPSSVDLDFSFHYIELNYL